MGEAVHVWGQEAYWKSLYLPLRFCCEPKSPNKKNCSNFILVLSEEYALIKGITLVVDVDNGVSIIRGTEGIWEISVFFPQFCCEPKPGLKIVLI